MKIIPFDTCTHSQKIGMLYELFPKEMPAFCQYVSDMAITIQETAEANKSKWNNPIFNFSTWLFIIREIESNLKRFVKDKNKNGLLFTELLYSGYQFYFMDYCI